MMFSFVFSYASTGTIREHLDKIKKIGADIQHKDSAAMLLNCVFDETKKISNKDSLFIAYCEIGDFYVGINGYSVALDYYFKALSLYDKEMKEGNNLYRLKRIEEIYNSIGLCMRINNPLKAVTYIKKGLGTAKRIKEIDSSYDLRSRQIKCYNNIGTMFVDIQNIDSAAYYYDIAGNYICTADSSDNIIKEYIPPYYCNKAIISWERGEHEEALDFFYKSLELEAGQKDTFRMAGLYLNLGNCYILMKNPVLADSMLTKALDFSRRCGDVRLEMMTLVNKTENFAMQGKYKEGLESLKKAGELKDSISSFEKVRYELTSEMQYLFEKQKSEEELAYKIEMAGKERQILIYIILLLFLVSVVVILLLVNRTNKIKQKKSGIELEKQKLENENLELKNKQLEQELDFKEREVSMHAQYLLKKNEFISSIFDKLDKNRNLQEFEDMLSDIKESVESSVWSEFNILFQNLHSDFYANLYCKHPNLTPNEKRLCVFLRLNLSTKEISQITAQQSKTIEIARSRLRAKLGLNREENLSSYLQQF